MQKQGVQSAELKDNDVFLTTKEVCDLLKISRSMLYALRSSKEFISPYRIGGKILWKKKDVLEWMELKKCKY